MTTFRDFLVETEEEENVKAMIAKLPPGHAKLLQGYKFKYQAGNTMKGDKGNIGLIYKDKITVAAPWNYGREFTTLHEIAHLVYEYLMTPKLKKEWAALVKSTKDSHSDRVGKVQKTDALDQDPEEIFCMSYACCYAKHKLLVYHHPEWMNFIKTKVPSGEEKNEGQVFNLKQLAPDFYKKEIDAPKAAMRKQVMNFFKAAAQAVAKSDYASARQSLASGYMALRKYWQSTGNEFNSQAAPDGLVGMAHAGKDENQVRQEVMDTINDAARRLAALMKNPQPSKQDIGITYQLINMGVIAPLANHSPEWRAA